MKALENIKWLRDIFVTRKEEQHFEVDSSIKTAFDEAISKLEALQQKSCESCKNWETGRKTISTCILGVCDGTCFSTKVDFMFELQVVNGTHKDFCCNKYKAKDEQ